MDHIDKEKARRCLGRRTGRVISFSIGSLRCSTVIIDQAGDPCKVKTCEGFHAKN